MAPRRRAGQGGQSPSCPGRGAERQDFVRSPGRPEGRIGVSYCWSRLVLGTSGHVIKSVTGLVEVRRAACQK